MTLAERLKEAMGNMSAQDLADKIGVSRSAVYKWLQGNTKNLKLEHLFTVAEKTGYSAKWIATEKGARKEIRGVPDAGELNLDFLTEVIEAVDRYLDQQDLALQPEAMAKVIALLYHTQKPGEVEAPVVAKFLRLVA